MVLAGRYTTQTVTPQGVLHVFERGKPCGGRVLVDSYKFPIQNLENMINHCIALDALICLHIFICVPICFL